VSAVIETPSYSEARVRPRRLRRTHQQEFAVHRTSLLHRSFRRMRASNLPSLWQAPCWAGGSAQAKRAWTSGLRRDRGKQVQGGSERNPPRLRARDPRLRGYAGMRRFFWMLCARGGQSPLANEMRAIARASRIVTRRAETPEGGSDRAATRASSPA
jgi:hypothetical protein